MSTLRLKTSTTIREENITKPKTIVLYAYYFYKRGIPIEKIKARWNFLKYLNVVYSKEWETKHHCRKE